MPAKHTINHHHHLLAPKKGKDVDMTQGNITLHIISFALPLLIGNVFQQLYNTVDTWVVGNFVSDEAYSAVGTVGPVINLLIGFFMGLSSGAGVVISQYYGAHRYEEVEKTVHTAVVMTLVLGVAFTFLGLAFVPLALQLMNTPTEVLPESTKYLTIYFSGILGLMVYNIGAGILRAVGDSKRPFYYLVVCAVMNTILDLYFVLGLDMGVEGVALATVISQCSSAILVTITLLCTSSCVKVRLRRLRVHWDMLKKIIRVGIPAALQMAITAFSNIFVQSYINHFGPECMAGWTTYAKVDQLLFLPMQSIALASTTFVGQNLGCGQVERARTGVRKALLIALCATGILMIPMLMFASPIVSFFISEDSPNKAKIMEYGTMLLQWLSPFYLLCCFNQIYAGALRGSGDSKAPMFIMVGSFVVFRQIYLLAMSNIWNEVIPIAMSYPAGWLLCSAITAIYYHKTSLSKNRLVSDDST